MNKSRFSSWREASQSPRWSSSLRVFTQLLSFFRLAALFFLMAFLSSSLCSHDSCRHSCINWLLFFSKRLTWSSHPGESKHVVFLSWWVSRCLRDPHGHLTSFRWVCSTPIALWSKWAVWSCYHQTFYFLSMTKKAKLPGVSSRINTVSTFNGE